MTTDSTWTLKRRAHVTAGGDRATYDTFSIALHWLTAVLVLLQFVLAATWEWFGRPTERLMVVAHMSFGIVLAAVIVVRVAWRLVPGRRTPAAVSGWAGMAARTVHVLLYCMLAAEAVLGFVLRWAGNESMSFFGLLIPPPFAPFSKPALHLVEELHELNGWAIVILAAGHAAAALYHHYVLRDPVLSRMLPSGRRHLFPDG
ncbi:cytochrome b [Massilia sp. TW-1]|uniref:Cytochrome b n=1 Tax=Telluria antibiotica TaxID=2717319 RepID=A0ABX0P6Y1_9BURK|nr:cytochrome b/b6 domain-containing protein [Telluria antibiotica]NIA53002.1 cytochrome b [Telluria antibiotica]